MTDGITGGRSDARRWVGVTSVVNWRQTDSNQMMALPRMYKAVAAYLRTNRDMHDILFFFVVVLKGRESHNQTYLLIKPVNI